MIAEGINVGASTSSDVNAAEISDSDGNDDGFTLVESKNKKRNNKKNILHNLQTSEKENSENFKSRSVLDDVILHFSVDCQLSDREKENWINEVADKTHLTDVGYRYGVNRLYVTAKERTSVVLLTSVGASNIKLVEPKLSERTKILIKGIPLHYILEKITGSLPNAHGVRKNRV